MDTGVSFQCGNEHFCSEQGRTRVYAKAYFSYVAGENPRRAPLRGKKAIYGWKLDSTKRKMPQRIHVSKFKPDFHDAVTPKALESLAEIL
jgi:hypothetical protein